MGIVRLMYLLTEKCPQCIKVKQLKEYNGQVFALDASMAMYQFLISTQTIKSDKFNIAELTDKDGNKTGHLIGLLNRTIFLMENGIKPVWVFDGKPPEAKSFVLQQRKERKEKAEEEKQEAEDKGNLEDALKFANQTIKITKQMTDDAKEMLKLMGIPVIEAPSEAEASCAVLVKDKKLDAACSEDMDTLCFGCPKLIRNLTSKEDTVREVNLDELLKGLELTMDEFVDLCILCGCDYIPKIANIGPVKAYELIKKYKNIESVIKYAEEYNKDDKKKKKLLFDEKDFDYALARKLFKEPEVIDTKDIQLKFNKPDEEGLKDFLINKKNFSESRVKGAIERIIKAKGKTNQMRLDSFFCKIEKKEDNKTQSNAKIGGPKLKPAPLSTKKICKGKTKKK